MNIQKTNPLQKTNIYFNQINNYIIKNIKWVIYLYLALTINLLMEHGDFEILEDIQT